MPSIFLNAYGVLAPCCMIGVRNGKLENHNIQKNFDEKKLQFSNPYCFDNPFFCFN